MPCVRAVCGIVLRSYAVVCSVFVMCFVRVVCVCVLVCVGMYVVCVCVGVCVVVVWHAENLRVCIENVPVCAFKTFPCGGRGEEGGWSLPKIAHVGLSRASEVHHKKPLDLTHLRFENRSRTTRSRFLQSFAIPDKAVQVQLS